MKNENNCFYSYKYLEKFANNTFVLDRRKLFEEFQYSYEVILAEAKIFGNLLQDHCKADQYGIAVCFNDHTPALCSTLLGILNRNCYFCPVGNSSTSEEFIEKDVSRLGATFVLSDRRFSNATYFGFLAQFKICNEELYFYKYIPVNRDESCSFSERICYCIGTSGSTGESKAVYVPYACIAPNVESLSVLLGITRKDVLMLNAPLSFDPFVIELFLTLRNGAALILTTKEIRLSSNSLIEIIMPTNSTFRGLTILQMTPSLFRLFLAPLIRNIFSEKSSLRVLLLGGEKFPSMHEWRTWLPEGLCSPGKRIFNIYGITEVSCWTTIHEWTEKEDCIPLGKPIECDTILRLIDSGGNEVIGPGKGELHIGSATRKCYITPVQASRDDNKNELLFRCTGDLVERNGSLALFYIGRLKNQVKRYGKLICLDQISARIENLFSDLTPPVQCCCDFDDRNKELTAFITLPNKDPIQEQKIRLLIKNKLQNYEKPDVITFINDIPLTSHGKKNIRQLSGFAKDKKLPLNKFCTFLENILGIETNLSFDKPAGAPSLKRLKIDLNFSFIAAGGTSFNALSLANDIGLGLNNLSDQNKFLNFLLNEKYTINDVIDFLSTVEVKTQAENVEYFSRTPLTKALGHLDLLWKANTNKCVDASPNSMECDGNSYICIGSHSHILLTLNGINGNVIASLTLPDRIEGKVEFVSKKLALVGCYDGHLYAFDFMKGIICWKYNFSGMIKSKPIVFEDNVIVASYSEEYNLSSLCLRDFKLNWKVRIGLKGIMATPILLKNLNLIVCTLDGTIACINVVDGALIWVKYLKSPVFSNGAVVFDETKVIIAEVNGAVHICNIADGEIKSTFRSGGNIFSGISVQEIDENSALIFFGCYDHNFYCLNYNKCDNLMNLNWKYCLAAPIYSTAIIFQNGNNTSVCTCSTKGLGVVLDAKMGRVVAEYDFKADVFSSPCVGSSYDKIYIGCRDNYVYCLSFDCETEE